jgi:hypothetical protein
MNYSSTWLIGACNINNDLSETQRMEANRSVGGRSAMVSIHLDA